MTEVNHRVPDGSEERNMDDVRKGGVVSRWADSAMYESEPIEATDGPRVYLISMNIDPLGEIASACKMYRGEVVRDLADVTDTERYEYLAQIQKTKLQAPFEFVKFHFMIEGVTRAFTHQMVRQRTAVYAQESLRFAVKEDMPIALPPSLMGSREMSDIQVDIDLGGFDRMSDIDKNRFRWENALGRTRIAYEDMVNSGIPAEDARGLLPHNILTRLHYSTDLRALLDHAGNRLCTQAQFEWRLVFARIAEAIRDYATNSTNRWQFEELSKLFKPVCYQTGKCEFKANFDRSCSIRDRVDRHEFHGEPSSEWDDIAPAEWLADPTAARRK